MYWIRIYIYISYDLVDIGKDAFAYCFGSHFHYYEKDEDEYDEYFDMEKYETVDGDKQEYWDDIIKSYEEDN